MVSKRVSKVASQGEISTSHPYYFPSLALAHKFAYNRSQYLGAIPKNRSLHTGQSRNLLSYFLFFMLLNSGLLPNKCDDRKAYIL